MSTAVVKGMLPASFIPVEFSMPAHRRTSSASSSSLSSSSQSTRNRDLIDLLEPSYRYLLRPGRNPSLSSKPNSPTLLAPSTDSTRHPTGDIDMAPLDPSQERRVRRKGKAYRSPPLEPTLSPHDSATDTSTLMSKTGSSQSIPGLVAEPLAYIGTINYEFILSACQTSSQTHDQSSNRSPPRNNDSSSKNSSKSGKRKTSAKVSAGVWDWKGKGNTRSAKESPAKVKKVAPAQSSRVRQPSDEPRSRSARPARASSQQRQQRNKSTDTSASQRASPAPTSTPLTRNHSTGAKAVEESGKGTSLVPPPSSASTHQAHLLPPPSPLRQSAIPVRLAEKLGASAVADAPMTRSASHGGIASLHPDVNTPATRGSKRRQSSAGPTLEGGEDEDDVAKRLRRAIAASIPLTNPSLLAPASPKRAARSTRPATRYATRSAPNSPPQQASDSFDIATSDQPDPVRVARVGLRRTMSHDALPDDQDSGQSGTGKVSVLQSPGDRQQGIPA